MADLSSHLLTTFEEITLLHRLTEKLSISKSVTDLCGLSVQWLAEVVPAKCVVIWFDGNSDLNEQDAIDRGMEVQPVLIQHGECPLDEAEFGRFIERLGPQVATEPLVLNRAATNSPTWFYPEVRELISVPIREGNRVFGWLLVLNHTGAGDVTNSEVEFGTVEACLMASVATILGIHCGNITLYREQAEFFASVVRALTSAIDAKDPYTCGHSDRVARLSVCLARELGCNQEDLNTIYLSGLLHDIGKIGIDDSVLRKPGPLTPEELEHIKTHPDLGCRILDGVKQLDQVLPVVRHHHEAWNGAGYPDGLQGEECPYLARIVAVADSIDAMSSDRPYRKGIPDEKLDNILREGAGRQWDAASGRGRLPRPRGNPPHRPVGPQAAGAGRRPLAIGNGAGRGRFPVRAAGGSLAFLLCWPHGPRRIRPRRFAPRSDGARGADRAGTRRRKRRRARRRRISHATAPRASFSGPTLLTSSTPRGNCGGHILTGSLSRRCAGG